MVWLPAQTPVLEFIFAAGPPPACVLPLIERQTDDVFTSPLGAMEICLYCRPRGFIAPAT